MSQYWVKFREPVDLNNAIEGKSGYKGYHDVYIAVKADSLHSLYKFLNKKLDRLAERFAAYKLYRPGFNYSVYDDERGMYEAYKRLQKSRDYSSLENVKIIDGIAFNE